MSAGPDIALKRVQSALEQHRLQFGRRRIPESIRQQTLSLLSLYPRKQVVNTLGISYKMLCRWEQDSRVTNTGSDTAAMAFVELPPETPAASDAASVLPVIELRLADGVVLAFNDPGGASHCLSLLQGLGYGCVDPTLSQVPGSPL